MDLLHPHPVLSGENDCALSSITLRANFLELIHVTCNNSVLYMRLVWQVCNFFKVQASETVFKDREVLQLKCSCISDNSSCLAFVCHEVFVVAHHLGIGVAYPLTHGLTRRVLFNSESVMFVAVSNIVLEFPHLEVHWTVVRTERRTVGNILNVVPEAAELSTSSVVVSHSVLRVSDPEGSGLLVCGE